MGIGNWELRLTAPAGFEGLPLGEHARGGLFGIAEVEAGGALRNDRLHDEPIEIGAQRGASVTREYGADPRARGRVPPR